MSDVSETAYQFARRVRESGRHARWLCGDTESRVAIGNKRSGDPYRDLFEREALVIFRPSGVEVIGTLPDDLKEDTAA